MSLKLYNLVLVPNDMEMPYSILITARSEKELKDKLMEKTKCSVDEIDMLYDEFKTDGYSIDAQLGDNVYSAKMFVNDVDDDIKILYSIYFDCFWQGIGDMILLQNGDLDVLKKQLSDIVTNGYCDCYETEESIEGIFNTLVTENDYAEEDFGYDIILYRFSKQEL